MRIRVLESRVFCNKINLELQTVTILFFMHNVSMILGFTFERSKENEKGERKRL